MKKLSLLFLIVSFAQQGFSQEPLPIHFHKGDYVPIASKSLIPTEKARIGITNPIDGCVVALQFTKILTDQKIAAMTSRGIILGSYLGSNTYQVFTPSLDLLKGIEEDIVAVFEVPQEYKHNLSEEELDFEGTRKVTILFEMSVSDAEITKRLKKLGFEVASDFFRYREMEVSSPQLKLLLEQDIVSYADFYFEGVPLNGEGSAYLGNYSALSNASLGGITGQGVVLSLDDDGWESHPHIDLNHKRVSPTFFVNNPYSSNNLEHRQGAHGLMVSGIMTGSGFTNYRWRGVATGSRFTVSNDRFSFTPAEIASGVQGKNISQVTSGGVACSSTSYNSVSAITDQSINSYDHLLVYACGNFGINGSCDSTQFKTIASGSQSAKNAISVGVLNEDFTIGINSSCGPTSDGRIKPEIVSVGNATVGCGFGQDGIPNGHIGMGQTSSAAPLVTGIIGLLTERYKILNNGTNPSGTLLKNIICNTAYDRGLAGPDFKMGFGAIDAYKADKVIRDATYYSEYAASTGNGTGNFSARIFNLQAGQELRVMLNWNDPSGSVSTNQVLQNNLNLRVISPSGIVYYPFILDPTNPSTVATTGVDNLNNIEQVIIRNLPETGFYTIEVTGNNLVTPQTFFVSYYTETDDISFTNPIQGDVWSAFAPSSHPWSNDFTIRWYARNLNYNSYTMEYSSSTNGTTWSSWTTATNTLGGKRTYYKFALPQTSQIYKIKFRVSYTDHNGVVKQATSGVMDVIKEVFISSATNTNNTTSLQWNAVTGASGYEVFYLKKEPSPALSHWESLGTTTSTNFSFPQVIGANDEPRVMVKTIAPDGTRSIPSISRQVLITDHCVTPEELTFSHRITSTGGVKTLIVAINVDAEINYTPPTYTVTLTNIYDPSDVITATLTNPSVSVGNWGSAPTIASNVEYSMVIPNNKYYSIKVSMNCSNGYTVESPHTEVVYASIGGAYCCTGSNGLANISKITMNTNIHNSTVFSCSSSSAADAFNNNFPFFSFDSYTGVKTFDFTCISSLTTPEKDQFRWVGYIDKNGDNDYNDANEMIFNFDANNTGGFIGSGSFMGSPFYGISGGFAKMRVCLFSIEDSTNDSCGSNGNRLDFQDYIVRFTPNTIDICQSQGINTTQTYIANLTLNSYANYSGNNNGYGNFMTTPINIVRGNMNTGGISLFRAGVKANKPTVYYKIWIDYNNNGNFTDAGEQLTSGAISGTQVDNRLFSFTVPSTVTYGPKIMRVAAKLDSAPSSCELFADGEVEDYILNITSSGNIRLKDITQNVDTLSVYPNPTTGLVTVEYSEGINEISLYDLAGRKVLQAKTDDSGKTEIDLSNYSEGVYFLCTDKGQTQKIIKLD